ncbi:hypothetical protein DFH09DRAFT_1271187 [Mycena vulgaris]|nr:hypothetical protein DFH09DRAFT_1271187 [Mycena vulgaris]
MVSSSPSLALDGSHTKSATDTTNNVYTEPRRKECCPWWSELLIVALLLIVLPLSLIIWLLRLMVVQGISTQKVLLSRITTNTPISGFYGPGAWWAWLITLGMSHSHTTMALLRTGGTSPELDYDLIAATFYTVAATFDLIFKAWEIAQLGEKASQSVLLPALVCAERVVSIGAGSSVFILTVIFFMGHAYSTCRTAVIAFIPLLPALVASGFTFYVHRVISKTAPVPWCRLHGGIDTWEHLFIPFTLADIPAAVLSIPGLLAHREVLNSTMIMMVVVPMIAFVLIFTIAERYPLGGVLILVLGAGVLSVVLVAVTFVFGTVYVTLLFGAIPFVCWFILWPLVYILAFFPQIGYSPPTGISVLEMDQITAFLSVAFVAAIRLSRPFIKAVGSAYHSKSSCSSEEDAPLLPVSR